MARSRSKTADPADWQWMFDVNVLGTKRVISAFLPLLRSGWTPGTSADILTVTSVAGFVPYEGGGGYNAAKYAERALVQVLRLELAGEPIRVIDVAPGMVETDEFSLKRYRGDASAGREGLRERAGAARRPRTSRWRSSARSSFRTT